MKARMRSARCWSCLVSWVGSLTERMFSCQETRLFSGPVPLDPTVLRDNLVDYTARTLWALMVVAATLLIAPAIRVSAMRALTRYRAQANVTVLLGNLAQLAVITVGALGVLAIYTRGAF